MSERSAFSELLGRVRVAVDQRLVRAWQDAEARHAGHGVAVRGPMNAARDLCLRGGKRLRAGLLAAGFVVGGGREENVSWDAAAAVELMQAYFLIHDDWMDEDRMRRGGPAVHAALELAGESPRRAEVGAVLAGDFTLALSIEVFAAALSGRTDAEALLRRFAAMQLDAVAGQKLDVLGDGEDIERTYRLKTGSYSVGGPLELGLLLSGASNEIVVGTSAFAMPLGVAFQLRDDLIGARAAETLSGKPRGSDLRAGKKTLLLQWALERSKTDDRALLLRVLGRSDASADELALAVEALDRSGAPAAVERRIGELVSDARQALLRMPLQASGRQLLGGVVEALVDREC